MPTEPGWKFSGSSFVEAGISNSTQCVKPPAIGASGSCMISTNDFAFAGASFHASAGDGFVGPASQVYFGGMFAPSLNAGLEIENAAAAIRTPIMLHSLAALGAALLDCRARGGSTEATRRRRDGARHERLADQCGDEGSDRQGIG